MQFLLLFFVIIPAVEIFLLIRIGSEIGAMLTIGWLFFAAVLGVNLIRYQGTAILLNINRQLRSGQLPAQGVAEGMLMGVAGVLLVIPGFASDFIALLLLIRPVRRILLGRWLRKVKVNTTPHQGNVFEGESERAPSPQPGQIGRTLEGEFERKDDQK